MGGYRRVASYAVMALIAIAAASPVGQANAQYGALTYRCGGDIGGMRSEALVQVEPGGHWGGPYLAGQIQNPVAAYTFTGELFGGTEGYISLVDLYTGQRIDRVWIGLHQAGFFLVPEGGPRYVFMCGM